MTKTHAPLNAVPSWLDPQPTRAAWHGRFFERVNDLQKQFTPTLALSLAFRVEKQCEAPLNHQGLLRTVNAAPNRL